MAEFFTHVIYGGFFTSLPVAVDCSEGKAEGMGWVWISRYPSANHIRDSFLVFFVNFVQHLEI
jgi:hypothetical protein